MIKKNSKEVETLKRKAKEEKEKMKNISKDFKSFAFKGNIVDMSIGIIIGTAFTKIVNSLVSEIITPLLNLATSNINFNNLFFALDGKEYETLELAKEAGAITINYGSFITNIIDFFIIALVLFFVLRIINKKNKKEVVEKIETTKTCPYCKSIIAIDATKCAHCTSDMPK